MVGADSAELPLSLIPKIVSESLALKNNALVILPPGGGNTSSGNYVFVI